ncbi:MAG: cell division protein SepF [Christensenellales bacterium]|jgi:cell division inhibitor SepF
MAKGFFNRILDAVGLEEEEFENDEVMDEQEDFYEEEAYEEPEEEQRFSRRRQNKVVGLPNSSGRMRMLVFQPSSYEEAELIIDNLKARKPVIMNLDEMDVELGQRILDFVGGAVYSLGGDIKKVARSIFVVAPPNVVIAHNADERSVHDGFRRFD